MSSARSRKSGREEAQKLLAKADRQLQAAERAKSCTVRIDHALDAIHLAGMAATYARGTSATARALRISAEARTLTRTCARKRPRVLSKRYG